MNLTKVSNPQGKGMVPVMESLVALRAQTNIPAKKAEQIVCELFTSQFILNGQFNFSPVVGRSYWMYKQNDTLKLSLIGPEEWTNHSFGQFVGECVLQLDMTWTLTLSKPIKQDDDFLEYLEKQREKFKTNFLQQENLKQMLPVYDEKLRFYQRILASGLAYSLAVSIEKNSNAELEFKSVELIEWLKLPLTENIDSTELLANHN